MSTPADRILHHLGGVDFLVKSTAYKFEYARSNGLSFHQHAIFKSARNPNGVGFVVVEEWSGLYELVLHKRRNRWAPWEPFAVHPYLSPAELRQVYAELACTTLLPV